MIILKQDKKGIVNFKNVTDIYVDKGEDEDKYFLFYIPVCSLEGLDILGIYETEERAKEVLEEITKCYINTELYRCFSSMTDYSPEAKVKLLNDLVDNAFRYEMPKE